MQSERPPVMADNRFSRELPHNHVCGILSNAGPSEDEAIAGIVAEMRRIGLVRFSRNPFAPGTVMATVDLVLSPEAVAMITAPVEPSWLGRAPLSSEDGFDWDALRELRKRPDSY